MNQQAFKTLRVITILVTITLIFASIAGAFLPATYAHDSESMAAQGIGQDYVNLFLIVPLLIVSYTLAARSNKLWTLIYGGVLFYILYSYVIYAFGVHFNRFFLVYCATLGLSIYGFIIYMMGIRQIDLSTWFKDPPVKLVSIYIFAVAVIFYVLWLKTVGPPLFNGSIPKEISDYDMVVNPVHVIDISFALPALIIGSVLLWRKSSLGYLIVSLAMVFMIVLTIALAGMVIMLVVRNISEDYTVAVVFGVLTISSIIIAILLFRTIEQ